MALTKEQQAQISSELATLNKDAAASRTQVASLGHLLGFGNWSEDPLGLLRFPARIRAFDLPSAEVFALDFPEVTLHGKRLISVLTEARSRQGFGDVLAPIGFYPNGLSAIIQDWNIADHPDNERNKKLLSEHEKALKATWDEFVYGGDRATFMAAIADGSAEAYQLMFEADFHRIINASQRESLAEEALLEVNSASLGFEVRISGFSNYFNTVYFKDLSEKHQKDLLASQIKRKLGNRLSVDPNAEPGDVFNSVREDYGDFVYKHQGQGIIRGSCGLSWMEVDVSGQEQRVIGSHFFGPEEYGISPILVWARAKQSNERYFIREDLPEVILEGTHPRANLRLGLILANSLVPESRDRLPSHHFLEKGGKMQLISEAQIPLMVYMARDPLMNNGFFAAAEQPKAEVEPDWEPFELIINPLTKYTYGSEQLKVRRRVKRSNPLAGVLKHPATWALAGVMAFAGGFLDEKGNDWMINQTITSSVPDVNPDRLDKASQTVREFLKRAQNAYRSGEPSVPLEDFYPKPYQDISVVVQDMNIKALRTAKEAEIRSSATVGPIPINRGEFDKDVKVFGLGLLGVVVARMFWKKRKEDRIREQLLQTLQ
jgi:hypothetical protein